LQDAGTRMGPLAQLPHGHMDGHTSWDGWGVL